MLICLYDHWLQVAQDYQNAELESVEFKLRLLALVAVVLHDLAVRVFTEFHPRGGPRHPDKIPFPDGTMTPDLFHPNYQYWQQYPRGPSDMVGYWAEAQILGGTVLFEHDQLDGKVWYIPKQL
jgi:hypothetical protein